MQVTPAKRVRATKIVRYQMPKRILKTGLRIGKN
jgi:hypothetical protein